MTPPTATPTSFRMPVNCPSDSNSAQVDSDGDGIGNVCDNCSGVSNPAQENCNGDLEGDACDPDLDEDDPDADGICSDVDLCRRRRRLRRDYDIMRGQVGELPVGSGISESCIAQGGTVSTVAAPFIPGPGQMVYYLGRLRNNCSNGSWGLDSQSLEPSFGGCD